jgi:hypothetical protein
MIIQELINEKLSQFIDQHGKLVAINPTGNIMILYGYIREVNKDHIIYQPNDGNERFKISNPVSFDPIKLTVKK